MFGIATKNCLVIWILSVITLFLIGCGQGAPAELTKVSIALDWFPWANHSGLYVAQDKGYFAEEGLDVNIYVPGDPSTVLQTVAAGRDDFGISYQPELLIARDKGVGEYL